MIVEIKPIETSKWHGYKGSLSIQCPIKIQALYNPDTGRYATGLNYKDIDPKTGMTEAEYYSKLVKRNLSDDFDRNKPHEFWNSNESCVTLKSGTTILKVDKDPFDYIRWKICKASKFVANSLKEYEEGLFPEATHYIVDEFGDLEIKAQKAHIKANAVIAVNKLSLDKKKELLTILKRKSYRLQTQDYIDVTIFDEIEKNADEILRIIAMDKEDKVNYALIIECLYKNILRKKGHHIMYFESILGTDELSVIEYLKKPDSQDLKIRLMAAVNE